MIAKDVCCLERRHDDSEGVHGRAFARVVFFGGGRTLPAIEMESRYPTRIGDQAYQVSVGDSLNMSANEIADVLHRFAA